MSEDNPDSTQSELPWNDSPADDDLVPGASEPEPAEVVGTDENPRDLAARRINDPNVRETLDERLAEEEPDRAPRKQSHRDQLLAGEEGDEEVAASEPDDDTDSEEELGAEEAAIHVIDDSEL